MKNHTGLTLIELIVTLAIFAFLVAIGIPRLQSYGESNRQLAQANNMSALFGGARSEAIRRGVAVTICGSSNSTAATPNCNTVQWESGWIVFADVDNDGDFTDGTDELLGTNEALLAGLTMRTTDFDEAGRIQVRPNGALRDVNGDGDADGTFVICGMDADETRARAINVSNLGRVSIAIDTDDPADNIVNDVNDANVVCP